MYNNLKIQPTGSDHKHKMLINQTGTSQPKIKLTPQITIFLKLPRSNKVIKKNVSPLKVNKVNGNKSKREQKKCMHNITARCVYTFVTSVVVMMYRCTTLFNSGTRQNLSAVTARLRRHKLF
jgi:hypothetical protein